jgi:hypothetical protein
VHEIGTPVGTANNDPKVCTFNFEGFGFDKSQSGYIMLTTQGKSAPVGQNSGPYQVGPSNDSGYFISMDFNTASGVKVKNGTYKATLYGKDTGNQTVDYTNIKAKSKVFKISCEDTTVTETPTTPVTPTTPHEDCDDDDISTPSTPQTPGKGGVEPTTPAKTTPATPVVTAASPVLPSELPTTGASVMGILIAAAVAALAYIGTYTARGKQLIAEL